MSNEPKIPTANRDPITGTPGAHPIGTGVGAALGGAAAGAAAGTVLGPVGTAVGAAVGAVAGGLAGKGVAEGVDPTVEDAYWRENYRSRPYVRGDAGYETYQPAYRFGWEARSRMSAKSWSESQDTLRQNWDESASADGLDWDAANAAIRDAYERIPLEPGMPVNRV